MAWCKACAEDGYGFHTCALGQIDQASKALGENEPDLTVELMSLRMENEFYKEEYRKARHQLVAYRCSGFWKRFKYLLTQEI